jgi:hypothetical protein
MQSIGYVLLLSGWMLGLTAVVKLTSLNQRLMFVVAGVLIELLGLGVIAYTQRAIDWGEQ